MRSIFLMVFKNIKKKKLQNLLICIIVMVCSMLFSTSISMLGSVDKPFKEVYTKTNASHDLLKFEDTNYNVHEIQKWWNQQKETEGTQVFLLHYLMGAVKFEDKKITTEINITERPNKIYTQDKLQFIEGEKKNAPEHGEIWLPTGYAYYNKIKVGDIISIPSEKGSTEMEVTAIVVDPHYSTTALSPTRAWIAEEELSSLYPSKNVNSYLLGIRYKDYKSQSKVFKRFNEYLESPFLGERITYDTFYSINTYQYKLIGSVLIVVSIMILVVALFIIAFTISNAVISDYKVIGILKSQGFSPNNITIMYGAQFLMLAITSIPLGVFFSYFIIERISQNLLESLGIGNMNLSMVVNFILTLCVLTSLIFLGAVISAIKAGKIKPSQAIRYGAPQKKYSNKMGISFMSMKRFSMSSAIGIKQSLSNKKQSIFLIVVIAITVSIIIFTINANNSLLKIGNNMAYLGYDDSQVMMQYNNGNTLMPNSEIISDLKEDKRVRSVINWRGYDKALMAEYGELECENIYPYSYDGDMDSIGIMNIEGRNPVSSNEVSLAVNTSKKYNKKVGDYIDIYINGDKVSFLVVGIYQMVLNDGQGFRVQAAGIRKYDSSFELIRYSISLKEDVNVQNFINDMKNKYGDKFEIKESKDFFKSIFDGILESAISAIIFISCIFLIISIITIFNSILMNIYEEKKNYGIYKALGMTTKQIRLSIIYKVILLTLIGLIIGIPLGIVMPPEILKILLSRMSVMNYPVNVNIIETIVVIPSSLIIFTLCAWIASRRILDINLRSLIEE